MNIRSTRPAALLIAGILLGAGGMRWLAAEDEPVRRRVVLETDLADLPGQQAVLFDVVLAPGASTGRHFHHGQEIAFVIEGTGTLLMDGHEPLTMKAGDAVTVPPRMVHEGKNAGDAPLRLCAIQIVEKGKPLVVPVEEAPKK